MSFICDWSCSFSRFFFFFVFFVQAQTCQKERADAHWRSKHFCRRLASRVAGLCCQSLHSLPFIFQSCGWNQAESPHTSATENSPDSLKAVVQPIFYIFLRKYIYIKFIYINFTVFGVFFLQEVVSRTASCENFHWNAASYYHLDAEANFNLKIRNHVFFFHILLWNRDAEGKELTAIERLARTQRPQSAGGVQLPSCNVAECRFLAWWSPTVELWSPASLKALPRHDKKNAFFFFSWWVPCIQHLACCNIQR